MYYVWENIILEDPYFFECFLEGFEDDNKLDDREPLDNITNSIITYNTEYNGVNPGDYPYSGTILNFLVSNKVVELLKPFDVNMDIYPSRIVKNNGEILDNFSTLNIYSSVECADIDKSNVRIKELSSGDRIVRFKKIVLDESKIPTTEKLFWLGEEDVFLIVHQDIVDVLEKADVTGINLIPIEEYKA